VNDLFAEHIEKHKQLEDLANKLLRQASLLNLHSWYQSNAVLHEAAEHAEHAAMALLGKEVLEQ